MNLIDSCNLELCLQGLATSKKLVKKELQLLSDLDFMVWVEFKILVINHIQLNFWICLNVQIEYIVLKLLFYSASTACLAKQNLISSKEEWVLDNRCKMDIFSKLILTNLTFSAIEIHYRLSSHISLKCVCWCDPLVFFLYYTAWVHFCFQHHCRRCGRCFCSACCTTKTSLPRMCFVDPVLHCNSCLSITQKENEFFDTQLKMLIQGCSQLLVINLVLFFSQQIFCIPPWC